MELKLLHLYHNLMNLYGEYGNIKALTRHLEDQGAKVHLTETDTADGVCLADFDFIYIGSGTEKNQKKALNDLMFSRDAFLSAANGGTVMLLTGNAFELLGQSITDAVGKKYSALGFASFTVTEQNKKRLTGDCICVCSFLKKPLVGFINKCSEIKGVEDALFTVKLGLSNTEGQQAEGFHQNNVYGTHLVGPVLVKNPHFMDYIVTLICTRRDEGFQLARAEYKYESRAYDVTLRALTARMEKSN